MVAAVVFFDKDGTLIEDVPYNADPARMRLLPGVATALRQLHEAGWRVAVVTNQSGVARGQFLESALVAVEARLRELLAEWGIPLAGFFYCPHHPDGTIAEYAIHCDGRKPAPGLILAAAEALEVDPRDCWMVGDSSSDVEAGKRAGCRTHLVGHGEGTITPEDRVPDVATAAAWIAARAPGCCPSAETRERLAESRCSSAGWETTKGIVPRNKLIAKEAVGRSNQ